MSSIIWRAVGYSGDIDGADGFQDALATEADRVFPITQATSGTTVISDSGDDASGGNGARTVRIIGLDGDWLWRREDASMNGTTEVALDFDYWRPLGVRVLTRGTDATPPTGNIDIEDGSNTVVLRLLAGHGQTTWGAFSTPKADVCKLLGWGFGTNRGASVDAGLDAELTLRDQAGVGDLVAGHEEIFDRLSLESSTTSEVSRYYSRGIPFPHGLDFTIAVDTDTDGSVVHVWQEWELNGMGIADFYSVP